MIKLELELEKGELGYNAKVTWFTSEGVSIYGPDHSSLVIWEESIEKAVLSAIAPISVITPNLTTEEIDRHYEMYP